MQIGRKELKLVMGFIYPDSKVHRGNDCKLEIKDIWFFSGKTVEKIPDKIFCVKISHRQQSQPMFLYSSNIFCDQKLTKERFNVLELDAEESC